MQIPHNSSRSCTAVQHRAFSYCAYYYSDPACWGITHTHTPLGPPNPTAFLTDISGVQRTVDSLRVEHLCSVQEETEALQDTQEGIFEALSICLSSISHVLSSIPHLLKTR